MTNSTGRYESETPLAEFLLDTPIAGALDAFDFPHSEVSISAEPGTNNRYQYTCTGLDTSAYLYGLLNTEKNWTMMISSSQFSGQNTWAGEGMKLYAFRASKNAEGYLVERSLPITIDVKDASQSGGEDTYSLSYGVDARRGLVIQSNIPDTEGEYSLVFSGESSSRETGISSNDYTVYPLPSMFAGKPAATYTRLEWRETVNDVTTTIASLDKTLTIAVEGDALEITAFSAEPGTWAGQWDMAIETDAAPDPDGIYILYRKNQDGKGSGSSTLRVVDGKLVHTGGSSSYAKGVTMYVLKVSAAVDSNGNATLTYTPNGTGYDWQAPSTGSVAQAVLDLVNEARAAEGLAELTLDDTLCKAAAIRAAELPELFDHTRPDGTSCFTVLDEVGSYYTSAGENIAAGQITAAEVVEAWMNSEGHRANIMSEKFGRIGIGYLAVSGADYPTYWVQLFAN